jgi:MFS family permease
VVGMGVMGYMGDRIGRKRAYCLTLGFIVFGSLSAALLHVALSVHHRFRHQTLDFCHTYTNLAFFMLLGFEWTGVCSSSVL